ncbi:SigB/SigF/SigG family RNA polymerase sigma factor [Mycobacterium hodleri]|uniref:SigB/SigF/SigG family RNA polymerase sigma factor n=1 Tax=Mycolicibacterium hodleri TaxID=49897 RepID=A0A544VQY5_9MYCO|nr:SigB/SigF/SigG family RNA polymerase sigma factor [Mycolicibacterium hodleri]TQR82396.1 SigB/SigF/SigG family RNA polymerase sigma factor [Mycolicibacterium hodleri]
MFRVLATLDPDTPRWRRQRDRIVVRCLPLATNIARRYRQRGQDDDDLIQVARIGLVNAVDRFDVDRGSNFLAFAVPTILGEVRRHFRDHGWAVRVPRRLKELHLELINARQELYQHLGRAPTATELAEHTGVDRDDIVQATIASNGYSTQSTLSLVTDDDDGLYDRIGDVDTRLDKVLDVTTVRPLLAALPDRERTILVMRFFQDMSQSQIAERIGISQMHVSRLLSSSLAALRTHAQIAD